MCRALGEGPSVPRDEWPRILGDLSRERLGIQLSALASLSIVQAILLVSLLRPAALRATTEGTVNELDPLSRKREVSDMTPNRYAPLLADEPVQDE